MTWLRCRLDWLATEEKRVVDPSHISASSVFHYSIPAFDEIRDGRLESPDAIGSGKLRLSGGEVLISKLNPRLSRVLLAKARDVPTLASTEFIALRPGPDVDERFLRYWLGSEPTRQMLHGATMSVTRSQQRVRPEVVTKCWLRAPSVTAQRAIADYLDAETARIDALIEKKRATIALLAERSLSIITESWSGQWSLARDGTPVGIEGWRCVRLGHLARVQTGLTLDDGRDAGDDADWYPYLRVANVQDGALHLDEIKEVRVPRTLARRCLLRRGDVLMTEGGDPDKLGRGAVWPGAIRPCLHQNHVFAVRPSPELLPEYLALITRTPYGRAYFEMTASKTTGIASTSTAKIASFRIPMAALDVQAQLVSSTKQRLAKVEALRAKVEAQVRCLAEHRQALITAAVTGQFAVPGAAA